jgi:hypothetical protein
MEDVMDEHMRPNRWAVVLGAALLATLVGILAYNAGFSHGLLQNGQAAAAPGAVPPYGWYGYGPWRFHPWGFGFLFPFLFFGLWFFALRGLFWGGPWRRHRYYYYYRYGVPPSFDDWHRRAHERMTTEGAKSPDEDRSRR